MKNSYDQQYEFKIANVNDIEAIMTFIDNHWKKGHIIATDRDFFEYEFLEKDGTVNFILAIDKNKGTIEGLNGFLKASHNENCMDIWGSIWKVLDGNMGMLGAEIIRRRKELTGCRCDLDVGDNPKTAVPVLKVLLKRYTAKMQHYYMLSDIGDYKIAGIKSIPQRSICKKVYNVTKFHDIEELKSRFKAEKFTDTTPYKDYWYIDHRFFQHPIYEYEVYGIEKEGETNAIFVLRDQPYKDRLAIRFVDYIGEHELISEIGSFFEEKLKRKKNAEYIDFYCAGLEEKYILDAGFALLDENDGNIIPNYFEPFVQENIDIWVDSSVNTSLFTKADADQDRPNAL